MFIPKTSRRKGIHQVSIPKASIPKAKAIPKGPAIKPITVIPKPNYGKFPSGHVY